MEAHARSTLGPDRSTLTPAAKSGRLLRRTAMSAFAERRIWPLATRAAVMTVVGLTTRVRGADCFGGRVTQR